MRDIIKKLNISENRGNSATVAGIRAALEYAAPAIAGEFFARLSEDPKQDSLALWEDVNAEWDTFQDEIVEYEAGRLKEVGEN